MNMLMKTCVVILGCGISVQVHADANYNKSQKVWGEQDKCAKAAFKQFPDYTRESNANRERALQRCLVEHNLPPRAPAAQTTTFPPPPR